jgi:hypothetical protein
VGYAASYLWRCGKTSLHRVVASDPDPAKSAIALAHPQTHISTPGPLRATSIRAGLPESAMLPIATELLRCREMTRWATKRHRNRWPASMRSQRDPSLVHL